MIQVGTRVFFTKDAAMKEVREVRDRIWKTKQVTGEDHAFLVGLLDLHPRANQKVGAGVERFEVRPFAGGLHFSIVRLDGSETDFSFLKCFNRPSHEQQVKQAFRAAVFDQVEAVRRMRFADIESMACPVTGEVITAKTCEIDHASPTFVELADNFAAQCGGYASIPVASWDGEFGCHLARTEINQAWRAYHKANAHLRPVSRYANQVVLRRRNATVEVPPARCSWCGLPTQEITPTICAKCGRDLTRVCYHCSRDTVTTKLHTHYYDK